MKDIVQKLEPLKILGTTWSKVMPLLLGAVLFPLLAGAQVQQGWVQRYDNGFPEGTNQAVNVALDSGANIVVTGFSQNVSTNLGYATIKYAPNGNPVWMARFDATNYPLAKPAVMVLDNSNSVVITGSALTVKYNSNGGQLWTAPYAGTSMAVDANGNVAITGFGSSNSTVKLASTGSNVWAKTYPASSYWGPGIASAVAMDRAGNTYVAGNYPYAYQDYYELLLVKYDAGGNQVLMGSYSDDGPLFTVMTTKADLFGNVWVSGESFSSGPTTLKFGAGGDLLWTGYSPDANCGFDGPHVLALDPVGNAIVTGSSCYVSNIYTFSTTVYGTYKADTNGEWTWTNTFPVKPASVSVVSTANAIAVDSMGNSYVTGYSYNGSVTGIVTIAYGPNGNQLWLQAYSAPSGGNAVGNAIAVDNTGNVYVAGYEDNGAGGTEFVLIKYIPISLQTLANGAVLLQAQGAPGAIFGIQASTNLINWLNIGTATANTNGLIQFTDTNAPNFPARFYSTTPQ